MTYGTEHAKRKTKTQVMLLKPRGNDATPCVVKCRDTVLEVTQTAKYLGVIIDDKLGLATSC